MYRSSRLISLYPMIINDGLMLVKKRLQHGLLLLHQPVESGVCNTTTISRIIIGQLIRLIISFADGRGKGQMNGFVSFFLV